MKLLLWAEFIFHYTYSPAVAQLAPPTPWTSSLDVANKSDKSIWQWFQCQYHSRNCNPCSAGTLSPPCSWWWCRCAPPETSCGDRNDGDANWPRWVHRALPNGYGQCHSGCRRYRSRPIREILQEKVTVWKIQYISLVGFARKSKTRKNTMFISKTAELAGSFAEKHFLFLQKTLYNTFSTGQ